MKTFVSMTPRSRVIVVQQFGETFIGEAGLGRLSSGAALVVCRGVRNESSLTRW